MEIDLFLDINEFGACGAALLAEVVISFVATNKGRHFVFISKIAGLVFEFIGLYLIAADSDNGEGFIFTEFTLLGLLFAWERSYLVWYFISSFGRFIDCIICCKCCKKEYSVFIVPATYREYAEVKSKLYEEPKQTRFITLTEDGMKRGLATLYYGSLFNTTDYLGAVWKSDGTKWGCFFFAYFCSIMFVSFFGLLVIIVSLILAEEQMWKKVIIGMSLYMNALGAFQHWINLSHGIYERCLLRNEIRKESTIRESTVIHIQSSEMTKTDTSQSQKNESTPPSQNIEIAPVTTELTNGWSAKTDPNGRVYYQNEITKQTQWEYPGNNVSVCADQTTNESTAGKKVIELEVNKTTDKKTKTKRQRRKSSAIVSDTRRARMAKVIAYKSKRLEWKKRCCCGFYWICCLWLICGINDCTKWCTSVTNRGGRRRGCCCKYFGNVLGLIVLLSHFGCISYGIYLGTGSGTN